MTDQSHEADLPDWFLPSVASLVPSRPAPDQIQLVKLHGGNNNRVFKVTAGNASYLLKWYFSAPGDQRDRLRTEWDFATFATQHQVQNHARPLARDEHSRLSLFEFLPGQRIGPAELRASDVEAAIDFLLKLNQRRDSPDARLLPIASESCFSIAEHTRCVLRRVQGLQDETVARTSGEVAAFVKGPLAAEAVRIVSTLQTRLSPEAYDAPLEPSERIISPSDFGFHNALRGPDGQLYFFDFEYAGWDDPAKTVCDFFSQVAVPVPTEHWPRFVQRVATIAGPSVIVRAEQLRPLYLLKWCCIVLNHVLKVGRERRQFSLGKAVSATEPDHLALAKEILSRIAKS